MAKPVKKRKGLLLFLAILYLLLGLFFILMGCICDDILCILLSCILLLGSILFFIQLLLTRRKMDYTEEGIWIRSAFGRTYTVSWKDISCLMCVDFRERSTSDNTSSTHRKDKEAPQYILISKNRTRVCTILENDTHFEKLLELLKIHEIPSLDIRDLLAESETLSQYLPALPFLAKCSCLLEMHAQTTLERFRESVSLDTIQKARKRLRIFGWLLIPAGIFSAFFDGKLFFLAPILILVTLWLVYIHFYPYIYLFQGHLLPYETPDSELDYYILPLPVMGGFFTLFFSIYYMYYLFMCNDRQVCLYAFFFAVILLIPFAIHQHKKRVKQHWLRTVCVVLSAIILGAVLVIPVNRLLTVAPANTEHLIVLEKDSGKSGYRVSYDYYYVYADRRGKTEQFRVSKSAYQKIEIGGTIEVRQWESILGFDYWAAVPGDS